MNTKQMQAALAKIDPTKAIDQPATHDGFGVRIAQALGSAIPIVRKNTGVFTNAFSTSYKYHEAVRKGEL